MLGKSFKIIEPKRFDLYVEDVVPQEGEALIKIDYASVCKADLRYYEGNRDNRLLAFKYPMSLLHEATGIVLQDSSNTFATGTRVVLVPNQLTATEKCEHCICDVQELGENYCPRATFASSNSDGFSKEVLAYSVNHLIAIPNELPSYYAVFSEMISVAVAIVRRTSIPSQGTIAVWGDGILGYLVAVVLRQMYPNRRLVAFGKHTTKLSQFPVDEYYLIADVAEESITLAFECVGGHGAESAIQQMLDKVIVGGILVLTGVTEEKVAISTRKVLEKGITLSGATRSHREDFEEAISLFSQPNFLSLIDPLILSDSTIMSIVDFYEAFERESQSQQLGKHLMHFQF